ncbi:MAG: carbamate kinase, partial [Chloroflexi bacterium]|nr:carbamate kinase [Chloroflexota bacterium]
DYASSLLATSIRADLFLISTAVEQVILNYNKPDQQPLTRLSIADAKRFLREGQFPAGSMGPKIEACVRFVECGGPLALITNPENILRALKGETGTRITA